MAADIHRDAVKLRWLLEEAPAHDAVLIAGDLLDIFSDTRFVEQKSEILLWRQAVLMSNKSFAWCSGNHDFFHFINTPLYAASPLWMRETPSSATSVTDGETRVMEAGRERIAITTIPWPITGGNVFVERSRTTYLDYVNDLLREGKKLQREGFTWILLCHEPPANTPLSATYMAPEADFTSRMIVASEPDFSLHGHIHQSPMAPGGSWIWRSKRTIGFNPGQSRRSEPPHYILLELRAPGEWSATWDGSGHVCRADARAT